MEHLDHDKKEYTGFLKKTNCKTVRRAWVAFHNQQARCKKPNHPEYHNYGLRGICVEYTIRQFVYWYLINYNSSILKPSVGRIDHDKNYSFDNIEIVECSENSKEVFTRRVSHLAKINKEIAEVIRRRVASGEKRIKIAKEYKLTYDAIGRIVRREVWKN
jgi:hypothetical protein